MNLKDELLDIAIGTLSEMDVSGTKNNQNIHDVICILKDVKEMDKLNPLKLVEFVIREDDGSKTTITPKDYDYDIVKFVEAYSYYKEICALSSVYYEDGAVL